MAGINRYAVGEEGVDIVLHDPDASIARETVPRHAYEPGTVALLTALLRRRAATFLDIGALYGYFAIYAARLNPACRVFAFEPNPQFNAVLRENVELNGVDVCCPEVALSSRTETLIMRGKAVAEETGRGLPGFAQMTASALWHGDRGRRRSEGSAPTGGTDGLTYGRWARASIRHAGRRLRRPGRVGVQAVDYDSWARENGVRANVAKIDVHGAEGMVLAGMPEALRNDLESLLIEIHPSSMLVHHTHDEIVAMLSEAGFKLFEIEDFRTSAAPRITPLRDFMGWTGRELMLMRMVLATKDETFFDAADRATQGRHSGDPI